jgi:hypothetical protein
MGTSPIPGGKSFCDVVPGGDLTNFDDRWKWISVDMLPRWLSFSDKQRQRVVRIPLGNPITPDSHIDYYDIHERFKRQSLRY